ncbi:hypothetical protein PC111_g4179 [Phytophthora cactorum]|nr:hypothetical protein PC111_g4179 [Phytophthora cactorum]KAG4062043.1 hypothetical protein PC123_g3110 [Phytophthora cactorum]
MFWRILHHSKERALTSRTPSNIDQKLKDELDTPNDRIPPHPDSPEPNQLITALLILFDGSLKLQPDRK